jgi:hypothetical protein
LQQPAAHHLLLNSLIQPVLRATRLYKTQALTQEHISNIETTKTEAQQFSSILLKA